MKRMMILVVIGFCMGLFGIDEFWEKHPELLLEYYKDVYLPKQKITKESVLKFKEEYSNYVKEIVIERYKKQTGKKDLPKEFDYNNYISSYLIDREMIKNRFNISKFNDLKKMGIDYFNIVFNSCDWENLYDKTSLSGRFFNSSIIFTATVIDSTYSFKKDTVDIFGIEKEIKQHYANFKLKVDKIIKGEFLVDNFPQYITIFNHYGTDSYDRDDVIYQRFKETKLKKITRIYDYTKFTEGEKVIIFIPFNEGKWVVEEILEGQTDLFGTNILSSEKLNNSVTKEEYKNDKKIKKSGDTQKDIDNIIDFLIKLEEINDTPNFYNRSYK